MALSRHHAIDATDERTDRSTSGERANDLEKLGIVGEQLQHTGRQSVARAQLSIRLAPGQSASAIAAEAERLLRGALPDGAELTVELDLAEPALFDATDPALQLAADAFERACGARPAFVRLGALIP